MAPIGKYYLGATPEGPLSPTSFNGRGGSANSTRMSASSSNQGSVQRVAQHTQQPSQPLQSPPIHIVGVNPIPAPVPNPSSLPLRNNSFLNQVPGTPQGETPLTRSSASDTETFVRIQPLPPSLPSDQEERDTTRLRLERERPQRAVNIYTGKMRKDFKVWRISSCLRKTRVVYLLHLLHHVRLRQPRLRLRLHDRHRRRLWCMRRRIL